MAHGICDQVLDALPQPIRIGRDHGLFAAADVHSVVRGGQRACHVLRHSGQVDGLDVELEDTLVEARDIQQIGDESIESTDGTVGRVAIADISFTLSCAARRRISCRRAAIGATKFRRS